MLGLEQQLTQACVRIFIFNEDGILVSCPGATYASCLVVSLQCLIHLFIIMHLVYVIHLMGLQEPLGSKHFFELSGICDIVYHCL